MNFSRTNLERLIFDFVAYHLGRLRGGFLPPGETWNTEDLMNNEPVFADSLELVTLAGMLTEAFGIHHSGLEDLLLGRPSVGRWAEILEKSLHHWQEEIVFFTSGSTGEPRKITHSLPLLIQEIQIMYTQRIPQGASWQARRVVSQVNANHIYGFLFTLVLPELYNLPVVRVGPLWSKPEDGDLVVTVPSILEQWHSRGESSPKNCRIISSTAPLPPSLGAWFEQKGMPVLEIYGSSETGGIATRTGNSREFELLPYWNPVTSSESGIPDSLLRITPEGNEIVTPLPDKVSWISQRTLVPAGRKDKAVQIGGHNVFPDRIAKILESLSGVQEARVRTYEDQGHTLLKAFIVPDHESTFDDLQNFEQEIRKQVAPLLASYQRPRQYTFGQRIPKNSMGKEQDW